MTNNTLLHNLKFSFYSSISFALLTIITFGFAMMAIPPSGPFCPGNCMTYPFHELLEYYPRDYIWMYLAVFQLFIYLIFMISNHVIAPNDKKLYSSISVGFAIVTATVLLIAYFTQFAVIPISMMKGETDGIALLTQYNGHGIFIAMEELGFITMSLSFLFLAPLFSMKNRLDKSIRMILILPIILILISFIIYSIQFGIDRSYRFEVAAITINWFTAILVGILISINIKKRMNNILEYKPKN